MEKLKEALNKDVKEYNLKLLILLGLLFITLMGFISYKLTNSSYALFTDEVTGTKTLTLHYEAPKTVTFDPDGGTIPEGRFWTGSGNTATKEVTKGLTYGDLPVPTKEGYTFKGWNGKNLAYLTNDSNLIGTNHATDTNIDINTGTLSGTNNLSGNNFIGAAVSNLEINETYYVSWSNRTNIIDIYAYDDILWGNNLFYNKGNPFSFTATTEKIIIGFYVAPQNVGTITNFQLEEGSTATEYEPYYITEDTKVVQTSNHTLKAIWEEEEETQTEP